jgi:hypothetical protein
MGNKAVDWPDPEALKLPAALVGYVQAIVVGVLAILAAIGTILRFGLRPVRWIWSKVTSFRRQRAIASERPQGLDARPLRFVQSERESFWGPSKKGDIPGTQIHGRWHVTNISDRAIALLRIRLDGYQDDFGQVITEGVRGAAHLLAPPIPPRHMALVTVNLMYFPSIGIGREPILADVIFTDNYEDEYRVRSAKFKFVGS